MKNRHIIIILFLLLAYAGRAQRTYADHSVLATGNWAKIGVLGEGMYKIDAATLAGMGLVSGQINSSSIRLFGNGGAMLPESNAAARVDDLIENAMEVVDGGDGIFSGSDYLIFYAAGPHQWLKDSANQRFTHVKNLYSDTAFYFITVTAAGTGGGIVGPAKRITTQPAVTGQTNRKVTSYQEHQFIESDLSNLLNSGKQWYGESFSTSGVGTLTKNFTLNWPASAAGATTYFRTAVAARTVAASSGFRVSVASQTVPNISVPGVSGYFLDAFAMDADNMGGLGGSGGTGGGSGGGSGGGTGGGSGGGTGGGSGGSSAALGSAITIPANTTTRSITLQYDFQPGNSAAQGWLNWLEMQGDAALQMDGTKPLFFRNWTNKPTLPLPGGDAYIINNATVNTVIWDITNPMVPAMMGGAVFAGGTGGGSGGGTGGGGTGGGTGGTGGGTLTFQNKADQLKEYVAFDRSNLSAPIVIGKIANQDLHQVGSGADFLIISHPSLISEANRLAAFHLQQDGYQTVIAPTNQIYQEFASGNPDPTAIRDFVKMYFDQANKTGSKKPRFLLLMGNGTYDYKNRVAGNTNLVPVYETVNSLDPLLSHVTDDYFALLDDGDDINFVSPAGLLDLGVGRIPAHNATEAKTMVDKIIHYADTASLGAWRTQTVFVADDKDNNLHLNDAESLVQTAASVNPALQSDKIYLDAYPLVSSSGGARYPAVNDAIVNEVFNGNLIVNYTGHGSYQRLAEESVLTETEIARFNNPNKLPLFITASCDFAPYDDPSKSSLGNSLLFNNQNGAIALMTTTRVVYAYSNRIMNDNYLRIALQPNAQGNWLTLGEATQQAKNASYQGFGDVFNNRKFCLLGDPAMRLAIPTYHLKLMQINGKPITGNDSLQALGNYQLSGIVTDGLGNPINNFNGIVYPTVYDKAQQQKTLGNDPASIVTSFAVQNSVLYKGRATVKNGAFQFSFIMPKDINYQPGKSKISLYATNGLKDAAGADTSFYISGLATALKDTSGPQIKAYLNDENFKDGGLTSENPILLLHLYDVSGISTSGAAIGHDMTAVIDGNERNVLVLNNFYTALLDSYQEGTVNFPLPTMAAGMHEIKIKVWDVANNSSEMILHFWVAKQENLQVTKVMNYPNPFTETTHFSFEHNQPNTNLGVEIAIFTERGQLVKRINQTVNTGGTRNIQIPWDGRDENHRKLEKGLYIYRIKVSLHNSSFVEAKQLFVF
ncbi:MAG: type IX secretion system sortase PorU [Bacteroidetes bacterium]|nr:type IX secretion system sortase PorU [Bacteroidota bacterium]